MSTIVVSVSERMSNHCRLVLHLALGKNRVYHAPPMSCRLRVLEGIAWVTVGDEDNLVWAGRSIDLEVSRYGALISAVGGDDLVIEVSGRESVSYEQFMRSLAQISTGQPQGLAALARRSVRW